ncbi:hypothetical protein M7775_13590 [Sporomusa sphaeroides DSM 2875]|uniref:hypothetical protein n=1 Tax=Sporomusa sphaeroides TaxID=47679 RepID=UPI00202F6538|nr:hypothetical protein [Sporomusa sphaeroides]MCM0759586.1 hypothetical protein [Sporomusa sphaeroides DSM 2875]
MHKFSDLGITTIVTNDKIKIELSISGLVSGFNESPNNAEEIKVKRGKRKEFAKYIARRLIEKENQDTGETPVMEMLEKVFEDIFEGYEDEPDILQYPEECKDD